MNDMLAVVFGGAIGAVLRYLAGLAFMALPAHNHFLATFTVNFTGCLIIGFIAQYKFIDLAMLRLFLITGILGGFTTYSAFSLEALNMLKQGQFFKAGLYIIATIICCLIAVYLGSLSHKILN